MPQFSANLSFLYPDLPFLDRVDAAAADGFRAIECLFPEAVGVAALAERLRRRGLRLALFNAPPGDFAAGERGIAALPGREGEFRDGWLTRALPAAAALDCRRIHVMAGLAPAGVAAPRLRETYLANLRWAAPRAAEAGVEMTIEPINPHDMPGYVLQRQDDAHAIVAAVGAANLKVQMDLYHCHRVEGDALLRLGPALASGRVGHLQIAGVPGRHEPDDGTLDAAALFRLIDASGWQGHVGAEYHPRAGTRAGLGWFAPYRDGQRPAG